MGKWAHSGRAHSANLGATWSKRGCKIRSTTIIAEFAIDYGVTETLAIDANFGYAYSTFRGQAERDGVADTQIGLRLQLLDETQFASSALPSLALRVGAII